MLTRKNKIAIALLALLAITAVAATVAWHRTGGNQAAHTDAEYFCPMHPQIVRDKPGECPVCGMKLEKRVPAGAPPSPAATPSGERNVSTSPGLCPGHLKLLRL